jgi:hypothetical protein
MLRKTCVVGFIASAWNIFIQPSSTMPLLPHYKLIGLGDMTISYRGRYESVYRERFGHIVYIEREKKKIYIYIALH